jgi:putative DNA primase/helicase
MTIQDEKLDEILDTAARIHDDAVSQGDTGPREFTENAVARRFAQRSAGTLIYDHSAPGWLVWGGAVWCLDELEVAVEQTRSFVESERDAAIDPRERAAMSKVGFVTAVEKISRSDPAFAVHQGMLDRDPWLLGVLGGVVELRTGDMRPGHPREFMLTRQTAVAPAPPGTHAPNWFAFLDQATRSDRELQGFLQRWAGYCLSGDVTEEVLAFLFGPGGNGKGVLLSAITRIMGTYSVSLPMEAFTVGARLPAEYYRAQMAGARLVTASETESGRVWAESQIKELTGNEAAVSARHPRGRPFSYRPQCKLQFVGNHAPKLRGRSPAMERRLRMVPFLYRPAEVDPKLKDRLRDEWPAILRWMIDGCLDWQRQGLGTAAAIQQASDQYFDQQDVFGSWLEERCILAVMLSTRTGELYSDYQTWCIANGEAALSSSEFAEARNATPGLIMKTRNGTRWIVGVGLRASHDAPWPD